MWWGSHYNQNPSSNGKSHWCWPALYCVGTQLALKYRDGDTRARWSQIWWAWREHSWCIGSTTGSPVAVLMANLLPQANLGLASDFQGVYVVKGLHWYQLSLQLRSEEASLSRWSSSYQNFAPPCGRTTTPIRKPSHSFTLLQCYGLFVSSWNPAPVMNPWTDSELGQYCVGKPRLSRPGLYVLRLTVPCSSHWVDTVVGKVQQLRSVWVMSMLWMAACV